MVQLWVACVVVQLWFSCGSAVVQLGFSCGCVVVQLWFSCGLVGLLCDGCGSVWFRSGLAWCGIVHLRFSFGSAWHGMLVYGSI